MASQVIFVVGEQKHAISRELLLTESQSKRFMSYSTVVVPLPEWVTPQVYSLIEQYLNKKSISFLQQHSGDSDLMVKLLRTTDYLQLNKLQQQLIEQVLIPGINNENCIVILKEVQKKMKNMEGDEIWYTLLTVGIEHLADNLFHIHQHSHKELATLSSKIMYQIFDKVIRKERDKQFPNRNLLFKLITLFKTSSPSLEPQSLCRNLRNSLQHKKITCTSHLNVDSIHGNLLWKLENMPSIAEKKTKTFRFLDMCWELMAKRVPEGLLVCLNLIPADPITSNRSNPPDTFTKLGVFYSKVVVNCEPPQEKELKIRYFSMNSRSQIPLILFDHSFQSKLGSAKLSFRIYCNIDLIYTFVLNYLFSNFDSLEFKGNNLCREELLTMISIAKYEKKYTLALRLTAEFMFAYPHCQKSLSLREGYDFTKMSDIEIGIYEELICTQAENEENSGKGKPSGGQPRASPQLVITPIGVTTLHKEKQDRFHQEQPLANQAVRHSVTVNQKPRVLQSPSSLSRHTDLVESTRQESRGSSKRKIFSNQNSQALQDSRKQSPLVQEMLVVTDLSRYLY